MAEPEPHVNMPDPDPLVVAERWRKEGRGVAIATVITTWGSTPHDGMMSRPTLRLNSWSVPPSSTSACR